MRFKRLIHPEVLMNRRGPEATRETLRSFVREIKIKRTTLDAEDKSQDVAVVTLDPNGRLATGFPAIRELLGLNGRGKADWVLVRFIMMMQHFHQKHFKSYYLNSDFAETLGSVDLKIPTQVLPESFEGYIVFPEGLRDEDMEVGGCYIRICKNQDLSIPLTDCRPDEKVLWLCYTDSDFQGRVCDLLGPLTDARISNIMEFVADSPMAGDYTYRNGLTKASSEHNAFREKLFRTALNAVIYLYSQDAFLLNCTSDFNITNKKKQEARQAGTYTECTVPLVLLNPGYEQPKEFTKDSTWVRSHPRWQPCGPRNSLVKLIWVTAHERHYRMGLTTEIVATEPERNQV